MVKQIKNLVGEPLQRRTAPFASLPVDQEPPAEDVPIVVGGGGDGGGETAPIVEPEPEAPDYPGKSDGHRQDIFNRHK